MGLRSFRAGGFGILGMGDVKARFKAAGCCLRDTIMEQRIVASS